MWVPLRATVRADDDNGRAEIFDEMPARASDGEYVGICVDIAENLEGSMMLEEEIHFYAYAANVLEHIRELHVLRVRAKTVEAAIISDLS